MKKSIMAVMLGAGLAIASGTGANAAIRDKIDGGQFGLKAGYAMPNDNFGIDVPGADMDFDGDISFGLEYDLPLDGATGNAKLLYTPSFSADIETGGVTAGSVDVSYFQLSINYLKDYDGTAPAEGIFYYGGGLGYGKAQADYTLIATGSGSEAESSIDINLIAGYRQASGFNAEISYVADEKILGFYAGYKF